MGRAVEQEVDDVDLQPARLTVDLLRPVALQPLQMHSSVVCVTAAGGERPGEWCK
ncbi:hypothetical protein I549_3689 [Mycobacterium avium subsp. avium 2285 (R)]|nr:hypothetical protein I549_3689 [Mycobacterium avium subsp. avium 2285 (R)]